MRIALLVSLTWQSIGGAALLKTRLAFSQALRCRTAVAACRLVLASAGLQTFSRGSAGCAGLLVGRSHECDYGDVEHLPTLTSATNDFISSAQMNDAVSMSLGELQTSLMRPPRQSHG